MTTISGIDIKNASPQTFSVSDGNQTYTLPAATPGQPGTLNLKIQIATYTIKSGSLTIGSVQLSSDATVTSAIRRRVPAILS
ncbi:hypothetical protein IF1G_07473 [Cordyceps javanica]|uniref:Uncharacterized protein n=1 Tax=Cordyceps javanica TaxID=43265 RepID=A0A545UWC2_9HYPO|nr:hypothetical protein IF1G_07473 [Cordyceps javanica]